MTPEEVLDSVDLCHHCSKCCHLVIDDKLTDIPCPYLVIGEDGKSRCTTYRRRLGRFITTQGHTFMCIPRAISRWNFEGCEYNQPGKPMLQDIDNKTPKSI